jgi:hypothetical protein
MDGVTAADWTETAPYSPTEGERTVYPATLDETGLEVDASMNVRFDESFELAPFAIGTMDGVTPGETVPEDSSVAFDVDLLQSGVVRYLRASLDAGRIFFTATSLHSGGQGVRTFPEYHTRDSLLGDAPRLELTVRLFEHEEVITISSIPSAPAAGMLRFPVVEGREFGVRWSMDLKSWFLIREPVLTSPEAGILEWQDDSATEGLKFYQVYLKP